MINDHEKKMEQFHFTMNDLRDKHLQETNANLHEIENLRNANNNLQHAKTQVERANEDQAQ